MSHRISAIDRRLSVYTFSLTTDWFHTVNEVAARSAPASAASRRGHTAGTIFRSQRSPIRNQHPADTALVAAANRLMRCAYPAAQGIRPHTCAARTKNGLPGGCGMPSVYAAAMYSDVSQNCVVGARVTTYSTRAPTNTAAAIQYGGRSGSATARETGGLLPTGVTGGGAFRVCCG